MGLLTRDEQRTLGDLLLKLPNIRDEAVRRSLLAGLPDTLRHSIASSWLSPVVHVMTILETVESETWAQLPDDSWATIRVVENALYLARGARLEVELQNLLDALKGRAAERALPQPATPPRSPAFRLTGSQYQQLYQALLAAFPSPAALARLVQFRLAQNLDVIAGGDNLGDRVFDLMRWAEANGRLDDLIAGARNENPGNSVLRAVAEEIGLAPASPPAAVVENVVVKSSNFTDPEAWRATMSGAETTVCRVDAQRATGEMWYGTGFLLGPSVVMTCYYVLEPVIKGDGASPQDVILRFDYQTNADGTTINPGQEYRLAEDWLIDYSPADELDYVLLRVEGTPGDDPVSGQAGAPRRWLTPAQAHIFRPSDPLCIIQHPQAGPLKITFVTNAIVGVNVEQTRVTYRIETEPGSGGSPCFNDNWELVALHHAARPDLGWSEGIPIATIAARPKVRAALGT